MFENLRKQGREYRARDEALYEIAASEVEQGIQRKGLWAKALAEASFDPNHAKAHYLRLRVQSLHDEVNDAKTVVTERTTRSDPREVVQADEMRVAPKSDGGNPAFFTIVLIMFGAAFIGLYLLDLV